MTSPLFRFFLCLMAGATSAFSMAPLNYWWLLFAGFSALYYVLSETKKTSAAFLYGFAFSYAYFVINLSWIGNALLVEGNDYAWAYPLALLGLPIAVSGFLAVGTAIVHKFFNLTKLYGYFGFVAIVALMEWARGNVVLGGFPWNSFGYAWASVLEIVQVVWLDDVYLLTLLTVFWTALPGFMLVFKASRNARSLLVLFAVLSFAACHEYGEWRLKTNPTTYNQAVDIRIVQPNIEQHEKWTAESFDENLFKHVSLSLADSNAAKTSYIVWPETSLSYRYTSDEMSMRQIMGALGSYEGDAYLLTGFFRLYPEERKSYNSLVMINERGEMTNIYDKHHLVPFGEYIPLQQWIPLAPVAAFFGFTPGSGPTHFETPQGISYSPLICYEVIFPREAIDYTATSRPDFMVNIANDAWYGDSAGPHQHLTQGIFRAVETGVPLVRSTSTGVSALVDPLGRVLQQAEQFKPQLIVSRLPVKIETPEGFSFLKGKLFFALSALLLCLGILGRRLESSV